MLTGSYLPTPTPKSLCVGGERGGEGERETERERKRETQKERQGESEKKRERGGGILPFKVLLTLRGHCFSKSSTMAFGFVVKSQGNDQVEAGEDI